jgi:hypothetical protein
MAIGRIQFEVVVAWFRKHAGEESS